MSNLTSDQRWNKRHGLPLDSNDLQVAEHLAKNALNPETRRRAAVLAKRLRGDSAKNPA